MISQMVVWNGRRVPFRGLNAPPRNAKVQTLNGIKKISTYNKCKSFLDYVKSFMNCDTQTHKSQRVAVLLLTYLLLKQNWYKTPPSNIKNAGWWQERQTCPFWGIKRSHRNAKIQILNGTKKCPHTIIAKLFQISLNHSCKCDTQTHKKTNASQPPPQPITLLIIQRFNI